MRRKLTTNFRLLLAISIILLFSALSTALSSSQTSVVKHTTSNNPASDGFWKRNVQWKSRWVKYWRPKAIYVPVWKKVWSPLVQNEWVPLPKVPPGWEVRKDGVIDSSSSSDWSSNSVDNSSGSGSSSSSGLRTAKSYSDWSGASVSNSYDSIHSGSSSGNNRWKKAIKRTHVREVAIE